MESDSIIPRSCEKSYFSILKTARFIWVLAILFCPTIILSQQNEQLRPFTLEKSLKLNEKIICNDLKTNVFNNTIENEKSFHITLVLQPGRNKVSRQQVVEALEKNFPNQKISITNDLKDLRPETNSIQVSINNEKQLKTPLTVVVFDLENPKLEQQQDIYITLEHGQSKVRVDYYVHASDNVSAEVYYSVLPGSYFSKGINSVKIQAHDPSGNVTSDEFKVVVQSDLSYERDNEIVKVDFDLQLSPNPVSVGNKINVQFNSEENEELMVQVIDQTGKIIHCQSVLTQTGVNSMNLSLFDLEPGYYYLRLTNQSSFIIQKPFTVR